MLILSVATRLTRWASPKPELELLGLWLNFYNPKEITTRLARTRLTRNPNRVGPKSGGLAQLTSLLYLIIDVTLSVLVCPTKDVSFPLLEKVLSHINYKIIFLSPLNTK